MKVSDMKQILEQRMASKHKELAHCKDSFLIMVTNEMNTSAFERNAINILQEMQTLKSEIRECESILSYIQVSEASKANCGSVH